jgi:hypothetical protein
LGESAQAEVASVIFVPKQSLAEFCRDETKHPIALAFALQIEPLLMAYKQMCDSNKQKIGYTRALNNVKRRDPEIEFSGCVTQPQKPAFIKNGVNVFRPRGADDPRLLGTLMQTLRPMMGNFFCLSFFSFFFFFF